MAEELRLQTAETQARADAEASLRESEALYRDLVETSPDLIAIHVDEILVYINAAGAALLGAGSPGELIGQSIVNFTMPERWEAGVARRRRILSGEPKPHAFEAALRRVDGQAVPAEAVSMLTTYQGRKAIRIVARDIGERKRNEDALRESEQQYRSLFAAAQRQAQELTLLYDSAAELDAQSDLPGLLQTIVDRASSLLSAQGGCVYLYDPARDELELAVARGFAGMLGTRLGAGEGAAGRVAQTRRTLVVDDYRTWSERSTAYESVPFQALVQAPMLAGGELIGVLGAYEVAPSDHRFNDADARLLSLFAAQAASAVRQTRLLEDSRARARQLELLYDAGLTLNGVLEPGVQLELLSRIAMQAVHADRVEFFRFDRERGVLTHAFGLAQPAEARPLPQADRVFTASKGGLVESVSRTGLPLNLADVRADPRYIVVDPDVRSGLWVPLAHKNHPLGVLVALSRRAGAFMPQDERLLVLFANQLSVALDNARLFEETLQRLAALEAVSKVSSALRAAQTSAEIVAIVLDETLALMKTAAGSIWLYEPAADELRQVSARGWLTQQTRVRKPGSGLSGRAFVSGQTQVSREFRSDAHAFEDTRALNPEGWGGAVVPIRTAEQVIGVIAVSVQLPRELRPDERHLLTTIAEIAGNAIHRSRLHQQTKSQLRHVAALHQIDVAISASQDLPSTLRALIDEVVAQLGVDACDVLLYKAHSQSLEYALGRGFLTRGIERSHLRIGEGHAGRAALERKVAAVPDLAAPGAQATQIPLLVGEGFVSQYAAPLIAKGELKGVLEIFHRSRLDPEPEWLAVFEALATQAAIAIDNSSMLADLQQSNLALAIAYDATIEGWSRALDLRDRETESHSRRVTELTLALAQAMGIAEGERIHIRRGALLHDIGKMGVPDNILLKPGPLSEEEWKVMRQHPVYAYELLAPVAFLRQALDIPYCHHEKWDGSGYPRGLSGEQIPLAARIFAVVDVWDALCSDRPYRPGWPDARVRAYLREQSGKHFDPAVTQTFLRLLDSQA